MKRRVKSWEDLLLVGELDSDGHISKEGDNYPFQQEMKVYCGQEIDLIGGNPEAGYVGSYQYWYFPEWMLEPLIATDNSLTKQEAVWVIIGGLDLPAQKYIYNRLKEALND